MSGFVKLYSSILDSSVWAMNKDTKVLWITMLAMSDKNGIVDASIVGLAKRAGLTLDECKNVLAYFEGPDEYSKSDYMEGRRVEKIKNGGWRIINFERYRGELVSDKIKRQTKERVQKHRNKKDVTQCNASNAQTETETETGNTTLRSYYYPSAVATGEGSFRGRLDDPLLAPSSQGNISDKGQISLPIASLSDLTSETDQEQIKIRKTKKKKTISKTESKGGATWEAYSFAYEQRYGVKPIRNVRSNALCAQLVDRVGAENSPMVASYYLGLSTAWYVSKGHSLQLLVSDAEKIYMEWKTGRKITRNTAETADRRQTTKSAVDEVIARLREEEQEKLRCSTNGGS